MDAAELEYVKALEQEVEDSRVKLAEIDKLLGDDPKQPGLKMQCWRRERIERLWGERGGAEAARLATALEQTPRVVGDAYGDAQSNGADANGAYDLAMDALAEHVAKALEAR